MLSKRMLFVLFGALLALSGCQFIAPNAEDKIAEGLAENIIRQSMGEDIDLDVSGDNVSIKTKEGNIDISGGETDGMVTINTDEGSSVMTGGDTRPVSAPADLPSLQGATEFFWAGVEGNGILSYTVSGKDATAVCDMQIKLLTGLGWKTEAAYSMTVAGSASQVLNTDAASVALSCTVDEEAGVVSVSMVKGSSS